MLFFSDEVNSFNKAYAGLFGLNDEDEDVQNEGQGDEEENEGGLDQASGVEGFFKRWGWFYDVDVVSETLRISWDDVLQKSIVEFLNVLSYRKDKTAWEKDSIKKINKIR